MKLVLCFALFALASAIPPAQYPAGVTPQQCPNYPFCGSAPAPIGNPGQGTYYGSAVAGQGGYRAGQGGYYAGPGGYNAGQAAYPAGQASYTPGQGAYYAGQSTYNTGAAGIGSAPTSSLGGAGYGLSSVAGQGNANYNSLHGAQTRYPAGLNPSSCPNYPLC